MSGPHRIRRAAGLSALAASALVAAVLGPVSSASAATGPVISTDPYTQATCKATTRRTTRRTSSPTPSRSARRSSPRSRSAGSTTAAPARSASPRRPTAARTGRAGCCPASPSGRRGVRPPGPNDRATDASVAYDAAQRLADLVADAARGRRRARQRRRHQPLDRRRLTWRPPVTTATGGDLDKNWIVCDNTATSPFYGHCYTQWDDHGSGNRLQMSTSTDGGLTWSAPATNNTGVIGGQPVVQPERHRDRADRQRQRDRDRRVQLHERRRLAGARSRRSRPIRHHTRRRQPARGPAAVGGDRRRRARSTSPGRTADSARSCRTNDIVYSHSLDATGTSWSAVTPRPDRRHQQRRSTTSSPASPSTRPPRAARRSSG